MTEKTKPLRRYTELPYVIDMLTRREITFPNPNSWDDKNDSQCMNIYKDKYHLPGLYALCFSRAAETYHHWKIFCPGSSGMCIKFDESKLSNWANKKPQMIVKAVEYRTLDSIGEMALNINDLPFTKRYAFRDEKEFRIIVKGQESSEIVAKFEMPLDLVVGLTVNPWVPRPVFQSMRKLLREIPGCEKLDIRHSTVVSNKKWVDAAKAAANSSGEWAQ